MDTSSIRSALPVGWNRALVHVSVLLLLFVLAAPFGLAAEKLGPPSPAGTWIFHAVLDCNPNLDVLIGGCPFPTNEFMGVETFNADGTMFVTPNIPGVTIGMGVWKWVKDDLYTFSFSFFRPRLPVEPLGLMVEVLVNENMKMIDEDNYMTTDIIRVRSADGLLLADFPGTVTAKRYPFQNYNQAFPR